MSARIEVDKDVNSVAVQTYGRLTLRRPALLRGGGQSVSKCREGQRALTQEAAVAVNVNN